LRHFILACVTLLCVTWIFAARGDEPVAPATQPSTQPTPQTSLIKRGSLQIAVDGQGSFDPVNPCEVRLRFKAYAGELTIVGIAPNGAAVKKGDRLLELDQAVMKRMLAAAENEALAAKASLEKSEADTKVSEAAAALTDRQQEETLKEAEQGVKWFETVDGPQILKQTDLQVNAFKNQVNDEEDELDQLKKLYKSEELTNATADIVVKRAVRQLDLSKTGYAMAEARASKTRTYSYPAIKQRIYEGLESAQQQYALYQASARQAKVLRETNLAAAHAGYDAVMLKLGELKEDAEKLTVRASCDGVVCYGQCVNGTWSGGDARALRPGEHVQPQAVLMTVFQPSRLRVVMELSETKFFAVQTGQKASLSPVAFPEMKYEGMCDVGSRTVVGQAGYQLLISAGDVDAKLVPGMKVQVHMDVPLVEGVLLAPNTAVSNSKVSVKTANGFESRHVMTGRSDGTSIEILSGLHEGDEVMTQGK
jgi:multidrug resistance efflux pump